MQSKKEMLPPEVLCRGCGSCAGFCPQGAITMDESGGKFLPQIDFSKCVDCGLCIRVCPATSDVNELNEFVFGKKPKDVWLGNYLNFYAGYSTNDKIRYNSSSGGLVTTLLIFALEKRLIDGALITKFKRNDPLRPEVFLAKSPREIIRASGSKYCPVPLSSRIDKILKNKGNYAVVGLPCHIYGIRYAEMMFKEVRDKITLRLGLFCQHNVTFDGTKALLRRLGVHPKNVEKLSYRGEGWPGKVTISLKNGNKKQFPFRYMWSALFGAFFYSPPACLLCSDMTAEFADISLGDAWHPKYAQDTQGTSMIITRTEQGEGIIEKARGEGKIKVEKLRREDVFESHKLAICFKKRNIHARAKLLRLCSKKVVSSSTYRNTSIRDYLPAFLAVANTCLSNNERFSKILENVPTPILKAYTHSFNLSRRMTL